MEPQTEPAADDAQTIKSAISSLANDPWTSLKSLKKLLDSDQELDDFDNDEDNAEELLDILTQSMLGSGQFSAAQKEMIKDAAIQQKLALEESKEKRGNICDMILKEGGDQFIHEVLSILTTQPNIPPKYVRDDEDSNLPGSILRRKLAQPSFSSLEFVIDAIFLEAHRSTPERRLLDKLVEVIASGLIPEPSEVEEAEEAVNNSSHPAPLSTPASLKYKDLITKRIQSEDKQTCAEACWSLSAYNRLGGPCVEAGAIPTLMENLRQHQLAQDLTTIQMDRILPTVRALQNFLDYTTGASVEGNSKEVVIEDVEEPKVGTKVQVKVEDVGAKEEQEEVGDYSPTAYTAITITEAKAHVWTREGVTLLLTCLFDVPFIPTKPENKEENFDALDTWFTRDNLRTALVYLLASLADYNDHNRLLFADAVLKKLQSVAELPNSDPKKQTVTFHVASLYELYGAVSDRIKRTLGLSSGFLQYFVNILCTSELSEAPHTLEQSAAIILANLSNLDGCKNAVVKALVPSITFPKLVEVDVDTVTLPVIHNLILLCDSTLDAKEVPGAAYVNTLWPAKLLDLLASHQNRLPIVINKGFKSFFENSPNPPTSGTSAIKAIQWMMHPRQALRRAGAVEFMMKILEGRDYASPLWRKTLGTFGEMLQLEADNSTKFLDPMFSQDGIMSDMLSTLENYSDPKATETSRCAICTSKEAKEELRKPEREPLVAGLVDLLFDSSEADREGMAELFPPGETPKVYETTRNLLGLLDKTPFLVELLRNKIATHSSTSFKDKLWFMSSSLTEAMQDSAYSDAIHHSTVLAGVIPFIVNDMLKAPDMTDDQLVTVVQFISNTLFSQSWQIYALNAFVDVGGVEVLAKLLAEAAQVTNPVSSAIRRAQLWQTLYSLATPQDEAVKKIILYNTDYDVISLAIVEFRTPIPHPGEDEEKQEIRDKTIKAQTNAICLLQCLANAEGDLGKQSKSKFTEAGVVEALAVLAPDDQDRNVKLLKKLKKKFLKDLGIS